MPKRKTSELEINDLKTEIIFNIISYFLSDCKENSFSVCDIHECEEKGWHKLDFNAKPLKFNFPRLEYINIKKENSKGFIFKIDIEHPVDIFDYEVTIAPKLSLGQKIMVLILLAWAPFVLSERRYWSYADKQFQIKKVIKSNFKKKL